MTDRDEFGALRDRLIDAINEAVAGSDWAPPDGETAVLSEIVVVMGWTHPEPGKYSMSYLRSGSTWSSQGLVRQALDEMECADHAHFGLFDEGTGSDG